MVGAMLVRCGLVLSVTVACACTGPQDRDAPLGQEPDLGELVDRGLPGEFRPGDDGIPEQRDYLDPIVVPIDGALEVDEANRSSLGMPEVPWTAGRFADGVVWVRGNVVQIDAGHDIELFLIDTSAGPALVRADVTAWGHTRSDDGETTALDPQALTLAVWSDAVIAGAIDFRGRVQRFWVRLD